MTSLTAANVQLQIASLETLWVNNNSIGQLEPFLDTVRSQCPKVNYLSMLKNPACPNFFTGADSDAYRRYRQQVLRALPTLKYLDASPVTDAERAAVAPAGTSADTDANDDANDGTSSGTGNASGDKSRSAPAVAPPAVTPEKGLDRMPMREADDLHASFGVSTYNYVGKHSEGNRFITDDSL